MIEVRNLGVKAKNLKHWDKNNNLKSLKSPKWEPAKWTNPPPLFLSSFFSLNFPLSIFPFLVKHDLVHSLLSPPFGPHVPAWRDGGTLSFHLPSNCRWREMGRVASTAPWVLVRDLARVGPPPACWSSPASLEHGLVLQCWWSPEKLIGEIDRGTPDYKRRSLRRWSSPEAETSIEWFLFV